MKQPQARRTVITFGATCLVLAVAAAGSSVVSGQGSTSTTKAASGHTAKTTSTASSPGPAVAADTLPGPANASTPAGQPLDDTTVSPGASNIHTSNTTVTVNGQITQVNGQDVPNNYHTSYTSDDGTSHVDISLHSVQTSTTTTVKNEEDNTE